MSNACGHAHDPQYYGVCWKYERDRAQKRTFVGRMCHHNTAYVQLFAKIAKHEKSKRKLKHTSKKCKHDLNDDYNDPTHPEVM